jgi:hypothetical protein
VRLRALGEQLQLRATTVLLLATQQVASTWAALALLFLSMCLFGTV